MDLASENTRSPWAKYRDASGPWADTSLVMVVGESQLRDTSGATIHISFRQSRLAFELGTSRPRQYSTSGSSGNCKFFFSSSGRVGRAVEQAGLAAMAVVIGL